MKRYNQTRRMLDYEMTDVRNIGRQAPSDNNDDSNFQGEVKMKYENLSDEVN